MKNLKAFMPLIISLTLFSLMSPSYSGEKNEQKFEEKCVVDAVRYLSFYDNNGYIPNMMRKNTKILEECGVPHRGQNENFEALHCAYDLLMTTDYFDPEVKTLCTKLKSNQERRCLDYLYSYLSKKIFRSVDTLLVCSGINTDTKLECVKEKMGMTCEQSKLFSSLNDVQKIFFDEKDLRECSNK